MKKKTTPKKRAIKGSAADLQRHARAQRAIDFAEHEAGDDDAAFLESLLRKALPGAAAGPRSPALSTRSRTSRVATTGPIGVGRRPRPKGTRLKSDPRYLANVRALARRTKNNARIVGGTSVAANEFDDCVAVGSDTGFGCTGTLIAPDVVLTAGHCEELHTRVFIGNDVKKRGRVVRVASHVRHPRYDGANRNDVMLLFLAQKVSGVRPRPLASKAVIDKATDGRVVGFGHTNLAGTRGFGVKRQTDVPIVSNACSGRVGGEADSAAYGCHAGNEIVAGKPLLDRDTCKGDSGGPLYVAAPGGRWALGGVTSRGTDGAKTMCGEGGMYVRVDRYRAWITAQMRRA